MNWIIFILGGLVSCWMAWMVYKKDISRGVPYPIVTAGLRMLSFILLLIMWAAPKITFQSTLHIKPKIIFLDEPTTGLDPQARRNLWDLILEIRNNGTTVIITTHYMDEAEVLCDRVAIIDSGKIIGINSPNQLIDELVESGFEKVKEVKKANLEDVFIHMTGKQLREA